jgi:hypothetical protein
MFILLNRNSIFGIVKDNWVGCQSSFLAGGGGALMFQKLVYKI